MFIVILAVSLVLLGIALDRAWLWLRAERVSYPLFGTHDAQAQAMSDIAARTRRAEEQMHRMAFLHARRPL